MLGNRPRGARAPFRTSESWLPDAHDHVAAKWFVPCDGRRDAGVIVVPPIAHEDRTTAVGLVALGEELAARGLTTVSIDLAGTANGAGSLDAPAIVDRWARDVRVAVRALHDRGIDHVAVVGVRLGALVGAAALVGDPVDHFVAWAPVMSGRRYVRELQMMQGAATEVVGRGDDAGGVTVAGFTLPAALVAELRALDAAKLDGKPAAHVTLFDTSDRLDAIADDHPLVAEVLLHRVVAPQTEDWLFAASDGFAGPFDDIARLADHLSAALPDTPAAPATPAGEPSAEHAATPTRTFDHDGALVRETFLALPAPGNPAGVLRGVLTEPADRPSDGLGWVGVTTVGPGRWFVDHARREAAQGRATLRVELAGFGTSTPRPGRPRADYYDPLAGRDVAAAIDELRGRCIERVAVVGFCAGAFAALDVDPRADLAAVVTINFDFTIRGPLLYRQPWPDLSRRDELLARLAGDRRLARVVQKLERELPVPSLTLRRLRRHLRNGTRAVLVWEAHDGSLDLFRARSRQAYLSASVSVSASSTAAVMPDVRVIDGLGHLPSGPERDRLLDGLYDAVAG